MTEKQDPWDLIPDDRQIYLTKSDIDGIMRSILQVQLIAINASGCIRALKEEDDVKYDRAWNDVKVAVLESRDLLQQTFRTILDRNIESVDGR